MAEEKAFDPVAMDNAASEAEEDLANLTEESVKAMADWFAKWYIKTPDGKPGAGHKRLGRLLVRISKGN